MAEAHFCKDLICVIQYVDGFSNTSCRSMDTREVPGAEPQLSRLPMQCAIMLMTPSEALDGGIIFADVFSAF